MANRNDRDRRDAKGRVNSYIFHLRARVALDSVLPSLAVPYLQKPQKTAIPEGRHPTPKGTPSLHFWADRRQIARSDLAFASSDSLARRTVAIVVLNIQRHEK